MASERFLADLTRLVPDLYRFAQSMTRNTDFAEELVSETVITALKRWEGYTPGTNMTAWLFTIQANLYRNMLRKRYYRSLFETDADATSVGIPAPQQGVVELDDAIRIIEQLPSEQRAALYLVCRDGHSYEEAARILDCEVGTVKSRVHRARAAIAKAFEGENDAAATPRP